MAPVEWNFNRLPAEFVLFNQVCLLVHWKSKRKATWPMPLHQTCQLTLWNFISQDCYIVNATYMPCRPLLCHCSCNINACWPTPLLFKHAYWLSAAARWMLAGLQPLNQHACWPLSLIIAFLLELCFSMCYTCWYGVSLSAAPAGVVLHIGHTFWFGTSLSAMPVGVVPH